MDFIPCDRQRDRALASCRYRSGAQLFGMTDYLIKVSVVIQSIPLTFPETVVLQRDVDCISSLLKRLRKTYRNQAVFNELAFYPLLKFDFTCIEDYAQMYVNSDQPVFAWLFYDGLMSQFYKLLVLSWPQRLNMYEVREIATELRDAIFTTAWPDNYYNSAMECAICLGFSITRQRSTRCHHTFCQTCLTEWMRVGDRCPVCRAFLW